MKAIVAALVFLRGLFRQRKLGTVVKAECANGMVRITIECSEEFVKDLMGKDRPYWEK